MATYTELFEQYKSIILLDRITVSVMVAADTIINELDSTPNHVNRYIWAQDALDNPDNYSRRFLAGILAANRAVSVAVIQGSTDAQIQTNVDSLVDVFAGM